MHVADTEDLGTVRSMAADTGMDPEDKEYEWLKPIIEKDPRYALRVFSLHQQWRSQTIWAFIGIGGLALACIVSYSAPIMIIPGILIGVVTFVSFMVAQGFILRRMLRRHLLWYRISKDMSEDGKGVPFTSPDIDRLIRATLDAERQQRLAKER